ncbi:unnamed protein product [Cylicocyclus nassatus]|uniref:G protein-coupled receptor n=1 Tax=Cylicocyclus nassatus TaxID=53992 RepID=A0AA36MA83_CYLNA|nr:unnamed protein product [Cylicocyclus nassatus]
MTQDRIIPATQSLLFIGNGPCQFISPEFCFQSHNIMLHCLSHSLWSALLSFSYRLYVLHHPMPRSSTLRILIFLCYLPSFFQLIALGMSSDSAVMMEEILRTHYPQYDSHSGVVYGIKELKWGLIYTILYVTLPVTPIYIAIVIIRSKIVGHLDKVENMSTQTKLMHEQLLKVLTYQALLPMLYLIAVISYALGALNIYHHPLLEYCVFIFLTLISTLAPLVSLYFVRPYSKWISSRIFKQRKADAVKAGGGYPQKATNPSASAPGGNL